MLEFLLDLITNRQLLVMMFAGVAAAATVLTLAMPLLGTDQLEKRMASVARYASSVMSMPPCA